MMMMMMVMMTQKEMKLNEAERFIIIIIIIIITYSLTARVVGAPQMISQPVSSIFSLFSTAIWDFPNSKPVHSQMLSSHLGLCLPGLLPPFTVPCKMVLARPDERETYLPVHVLERLNQTQITVLSAVPHIF